MPTPDSDTSGTGRQSCASARLLLRGVGWWAEL